MTRLSRFALCALILPLGLTLARLGLTLTLPGLGLTGLSLLPSTKVKPPRLAESPINLECVVRKIVPVGDGPIAANLVIGQIVAFHVADSVLGADRRVDPRKLRTIARLGGDYYCRTSDLFEMKRP